MAYVRPPGAVTFAQDNNDGSSSGETHANDVQRYLLDMLHTCHESIKTTSLSKVFRTCGSTLPHAILRAHSVRSNQQDVHRRPNNLPRLEK